MTSGYVAWAALMLAVPAPETKRVAGYPTIPEVRAAFEQEYHERGPRTLGQRCGDPEMHFPTWVDKDAKRPLDNHFYWVWNAKGLDVEFGYGKMTDAWFYNEGADGHKRYRGELPEGLSFDDDLAAVVKKLGKPGDETEYERPGSMRADGVAELHTQYNYPDRGVEVTFRKPAGGKQRIHLIRLYPVKKS